MGLSRSLTWWTNSSLRWGSSPATPRLNESEDDDDVDETTVGWTVAVGGATLFPGEAEPITGPAG